MTGNKFGDDIRIRIKSKSSPEINSKSEKKGIPPSPQVFRNSLDYVRIEIKILSQTKTNYIGRPSVKRDYTNSFAWHIVNPIPQGTISPTLPGVKRCQLD